MCAFSEKRDIRDLAATINVRENLGKICLTVKFVNLTIMHVSYKIIDSLEL